ADAIPESSSLPPARPPTPPRRISRADMVGDRQDGAATAAPSDKKLGKITSTKVGSIYPTLTGYEQKARSTRSSTA
ncbi:hypothetical protein, partial [Burkholderia cepacia]|uniref:hypothetical protein n=1 Tax=Burkholderia cepacia TaxID=292 RepID=UPI001C724B2D